MTASERERLAEKLRRAWINDEPFIPWHKCTPEQQETWLRVADAALAAPGRDREQERAWLDALASRHTYIYNARAEILDRYCAPEAKEPEPIEAAVEVIRREAGWVLSPADIGEVFEHWEALAPLRERWVQQNALPLPPEPSSAPERGERCEHGQPIAECGGDE